LLTAFDLNPASGLALSILAEAGTPLSPNEIAGRPIISRGRRHQLLDSLEKRNYISSRPAVKTQLAQAR
jgi:DNA-binding MarR family transcriptional regulator